MIKSLPRPPLPPLLVLTGGIFAVSISAILIRYAQAEVPSLVIAAWRLLLAAAILWPLALRRRRAEIRGLRRVEWRLALLSGLMLGIHFATWITSLAYIPVANSTVLVTTYPLWVGLAAPLVLGERINRPVQFAILLAFLGSVVIAVGDAVHWRGGQLLFDGASLSGDQPLRGSLLALAGAIAGAAYLMIGRRLRATLSVLTYITLVYSTAAVFLLGAVLISGQTLWGYGAAVYLLLLAMAVGPQLLGHTSYNWALGYLPTAYVTVAAVAEPIGATILALLLFAEIPGPGTLLGSVLILTAITIVGRQA